MGNLHIFFLPFLAPGHMIPMVDLAKLFAARGVRSTIVTTIANAPLVESAIVNAPHDSVRLLTLPAFPSSVPNNVANLPTPDLTPPFLEAINSLELPFKQLLIAHRPDCIVSDVYYPWTADLAFDHNIPRIAFHGTSAFSIVIINMIRKLKPYEDVNDEDTPFVVPEIPHRIELTKSRFPGSTVHQDDVIIRIIQAQSRTHGTIFNSFVELEAGYADRLTSKSWLVGPVSYCNKNTRESAARGGKEHRNFDFCMNWLDSREPGSVMYVCFGSLGRFTDAQLQEISSGLENSGRLYIWVVRNVNDEPESFEERGKGLIIRGWAPQVAILNHPSVGGFMTHCGWNSCLEGLAAGVAMITWPQFAEQFLNERFMVDVLGVGVSVGAKVCSGDEEKRTLVKREKVMKAVEEVMGSGEEVERRREKAKEVAESARMAMEEGGSSYMDMSRLIQELMEVKKEKALIGY